MAPAINLDRWLKSLNQKLPGYDTKLRNTIVSSESGRHSTEIYINDFIGGSFFKELEGLRYLHENVENRFTTTYLSDMVSTKTEVFVFFHTYFSYFFEKIKKESNEVFKNFNVNGQCFEDINQHKLSFIIMKENNYEEKFHDYENAYFQIAEIISSNLTDMILNYQSVIDNTQPKFFMKTGLRHKENRHILFETTIAVFRSNDIVFSSSGTDVSFDKSLIQKIEKDSLPIAKKYVEQFNDTHLSKQALAVSSLLLHSPNSWGCDISYQESLDGLFIHLKKIFTSIIDNKDNYDTLFFIEDINPVLTVEKDTSRHYFYDYGSFSLNRILYLGRYSVGLEVRDGKSNFKMHDYENTNFSLEAQKVISISSLS